MRTASRVLGIISTCLALLLGGLFIMGGLMFFALPFDSGGYFFDDSYDTVSQPLFTSPATDASVQFGGTVFALLGGALAVSGILGLVGSVQVRKRNTASGVLFIIAAVLCLFPGLLISVLFVLAGIFAFVREKTPAVPVVFVPYPGWPAVPYVAHPPPQYPPYGAYPPCGVYPPPAVPAQTTDIFKEEP